MLDDMISFELRHFWCIKLKCVNSVWCWYNAMPTVPSTLKFFRCLSTIKRPKLLQGDYSGRINV